LRIASAPHDPLMYHGDLGEPMVVRPHTSNQLVV
jgi:hypothetical protein